MHEEALLGMLMCDPTQEIVVGNAFVFHFSLPGKLTVRAANGWFSPKQWAWLCQVESRIGQPVLFPKRNHTFHFELDTLLQLASRPACPTLDLSQVEKFKQKYRNVAQNSVSGIADSTKKYSILRQYSEDLTILKLVMLGVNRTDWSKVVAWPHEFDRSDLRFEPDEEKAQARRDIQQLIEDMRRVLEDPEARPFGWSQGPQESAPDLIVSSGPDTSIDIFLNGTLTARNKAAAFLERYSDEVTILDVRSLDFRDESYDFKTSFRISKAYGKLNLTVLGYFVNLIYRDIRWTLYDTDDKMPNPNWAPPRAELDQVSPETCCFCEKHFTWTLADALDRRPVIAFENIKPRVCLYHLLTAEDGDAEQKCGEGLPLLPSRYYKVIQSYSERFEALRLMHQLGRSSGSRDDLKTPLADTRVSYKGYGPDSEREPLRNTSYYAGMIASMLNPGGVRRRPRSSPNPETRTKSRTRSRARARTATKPKSKTTTKPRSRSRSKSPRKTTRKTRVRTT